MNLCRMLLCCLVLVLVASGSAQAGLVNGGFENGDLSSWSYLGNVSVSTGYDYGFGNVLPDSGMYSALLITEGATAAQIAAQMGITEVVLEASNGFTDATNGALIWQTVIANAGDTFQFRWNFVEQDYIPYDDWSFYGISFNGGPAAVTKFASLATVGPGEGSTINGWTTLNVIVPQDGAYTFYFGIVNGVDEALNSELWIDGAYVGNQPPVGQVPEPGTMLLAAVPLIGLALYRRRRR